MNRQRPDGRYIGTFLSFICLLLVFVNRTAATDVEQRTNPPGMELVKIPAGKFRMGQDPGQAWHEGGEWDEVPVHEVVISRPFWMGVTEVTNRQYEQFDPAHKSLRGRDGFSKADDEPVVQVSWEDATDFCKLLSRREGKTYRLPTEAEWEYACRAGTTTPYYTGTSLPKEFRRAQTNFADYRASHHTPVSLRVGQSPANAWGLLDMHGNVEEWCSDWYGAYDPEKAVDPVGRASGISRVVRGGSHNTDVYYLRSANRMSALPQERNYLLGFRVVQAEPPVTPPLPAEPPSRVMTDVSQEKAPFPASNDDPSIPFFKGPKPFVILPGTPQGPVFSFHNHDPALIDCANGDLLAIWYSTWREWGPELAVVGSRLRRGSQEWEPASLFFHLADRNAHAPALWRNARGDIYHFNGLGISGWDDMAIIMRVSKDNGATWSAPKVIKPRGRATGGCVESIIKTSTGKLLLPIDGANNTTELLISSDDGETWQNPSDGTPMPGFAENSTGCRIAGLHATLTELKNGDWFAIGRGRNIGGTSPVSLSKDQGRTWRYLASGLPPLGVGQRPLLLRLKEGPILFVGFTDVVTRMDSFELDKERGHTISQNGIEVIDATGRKRRVFGLFAALSFDEGKSWPIRKILTPGGPAKEYYGYGWTHKFTVDEDHAEPMGYPAITRTPDDKIHLVTSGLYYVFNLAWLKAPMPARESNATK